MRKKKTDANRGTGVTSAGVYYDANVRETGRGVKGLKRERKRQRDSRIRGIVLTVAVLIAFAFFSILLPESLLREDTSVMAGDATLLIVTKPPLPTATPEDRIRDADAQYVYLPMSGSRYHSNPQCSGMKDAREVTIDAAKQQGYMPCARCGAPE